MAGTFTNKTTSTNIFVIGEGPDGRSKLIVIKPEQRSPGDFDADFFRLDGKWYKISVFSASVIEVNSVFEPIGYLRQANEEETSSCERMLRNFWEEKRNRS